MVLTLESSHVTDFFCFVFMCVLCKSVSLHGDRVVTLNVIYCFVIVLFYTEVQAR